MAEAEQGHVTRRNPGPAQAAQCGLLANLLVTLYQALNLNASESPSVKGGEALSPVDLWRSKEAAQGLRREPGFKGWLCWDLLCDLG